MTEAVTVSERRSKNGQNLAGQNFAGGKYSNDVKTSRHHLYVDEPVELGSADIGPSPFEYLAAALGGCTTITLRMYSDRKKWPVDHIAVNIKMQRRDKVQFFIRELTITGDLDESQRARLVEIADKCPVHKVLTAGAGVETILL